MTPSRNPSTSESPSSKPTASTIIAIQTNSIVTTESGGTSANISSAFVRNGLITLGVVLGAVMIAVVFFKKGKRAEKLEAADGSDSSVSSLEATMGAPQDV